ADNVASLCEMKYSTVKYEITKDDDDNMRHKSEAFKSIAKPFKSTHLVMVTPFGVAEGMYMFSVQNVVTLDDLFRDI
ncbi:MAG: ATP-binding protein, partial [Bacteroidales bacterium]|nr:ATP-binding protein [Bacteroidales bacterium]